MTGISFLFLQEEGKAVVLDKNVLEGLVNEARSLVPQPEQLAALEEQLKKSEAWSARALRLFKDGKNIADVLPLNSWATV